MLPLQRQKLAISRAGGTRTTMPQTVGAPLKGWNTRDPFEAMDPLDAISLDNWYPDFAGLAIRGGNAPYVSTLGAAPVQTLARFTAGASDKFLAACAGTIRDITTAAGPVALGSAFKADIWQTANFNGHQFWVNGIDKAQTYDGTTLAASGFTGPDTATFTDVGVFNSRVFFWTGADAKFWYGPVNGIAGALNSFDLSTVAYSGGNLLAVETLSYDGGQGIAAYTAFFMSDGEVLLYTGTDPTNPSNWALVGRYMIPPPIASRAITRYGGDIYLATQNDHQQLSKLMVALKLGETPPRTKISGAAKLAYQNGGSLPGWQALYYPAGTRMIYNIPNPDGSFSQHIYNTSTQAWCRFRNQKAYCWGIFGGSLYFGTDNGVVMQADTGSTDNGAAILAQGQQAWQLFETPLKKRVAAIRPVVQANGVANFSISLGFDYQDPGVSVPASTLNSLGAMIWGTSNWGAPTTWGGTSYTDPRWHIAGGEGAAVGLALSANALVPTIWVRTDLMIEPGSAL